jgi:hypothetical protein
MTLLKKIKYFLTDTGIEKSILPFYNNYFPQKNQTGGSSEGKYVAHIFLLQTYFLKVKNADRTNSINFKSVCEFGPGDSVAIGLLYMIIYKSEYIAFDAHPYLDESISLEACRKALKYLKKIDSLESLSHLLESNRFNESINLKGLFDYLEKELLPKIRGVSDEDVKNALSEIKYFAPYDLDDHQMKYRFDLIYSQAVLEHCDNLSEIYNFQKSNLSGHGISYNHIDFKSHGTSFRWNGQYGLSNKVYKSLEKSNTFQWINRMPISHHEYLIKKEGLNLFDIIKFKLSDGISMESVSEDMKPFVRDFEDLNTHSSIVMSTRNF